MKKQYALWAFLALMLSGCIIYTFVDLGPWDFEDDTSLPYGFSTSTVNPWAIDTNVGADYTDQSLRSASPAQYGTSTLTLTIDGGLDSGKDLHFWVRVDAGYSDTLEFSINGVDQDSWDGYDSDWNEVNVWDSDYYDDEGPNVLKWVYTRNSDLTSGENRAWIDLVEIDG